MKHLRYLKYVLRHKWFVFIECFRLGIPWRGLVHDLSKFRPSEWFPYVEKFYGGWKDINSSHPVNQAFDKAWLLHQKRNPHHWQYWLLMNDNSPAMERTILGAKLCIRDMARSGGMQMRKIDEAMKYAGDSITAGLRAGGDQFSDVAWLNIADAERNPMREIGQFVMRLFCYDRPLEMPMKYRKEMLADWIGAGMAIHGKREVKEWYAKQKNIILAADTNEWIETMMEKL